MSIPAFPNVDEFYDWLEKLPKHHAVVAASSVLAIAGEGAYETGCADMGDSIWCYTTPLGSPNVFMRIYVFSDRKKYFPLHGVVTNDMGVRDKHLKEALRRLGFLKD